MPPTASKMHLTPSAVSSPGKVLLAGGYLVLDSAYSGLVFALSSRIHVTSAPLRDHPEGTISVESPQFKNAHWAYQINKNLDGAGVIVAQVEHEGYVHLTSGQQTCCRSSIACPVYC